MSKNTVTISGLPANIDQLIVQKSNPLLNLWNSPWTLSEFKLLDVYLARIDSHHPEQRCVRLEKGELEKLLDVRKINLPELQDRLDRLIIPVHVNDAAVPNGHRTIALFDTIKYVSDESGFWVIDIRCSEDAMKYIFNVENLGYLRYKLHSVINLKSKYAYSLFLYVEQNRFRKEWEIEVDELRHLLGCEAPYYQEYKRFRNRILKPAQFEISKNTDCQFSCVSIKKGRRVVALRFSVDNLASLDEFSLRERNYEETETEESVSRVLHGKNFLKLALTPGGAEKSEFSDAELDEIFSYLMTVPLSKMPEGPGVHGPEMQRYNYLSCKFAELNRRDATYGIRNRFAYLLTIIKEDSGHFL